MFGNFMPQAYAQCDPGGKEIDLGDCLLLRPGQALNQVETYNSPAGLVNLIVSNLFVLAGVFLFLMIIFAGFKFAMQGGAKGKDDAKGIVQSALIGFLIMFGAFWIIQIIEIITGAKILF